MIYLRKVYVEEGSSSIGFPLGFLKLLETEHIVGQPGLYRGPCTLDFYALHSAGRSFETQTSETALCQQFTVQLFVISVFPLGPRVWLQNVWVPRVAWGHLCLF